MFEPGVITGEQLARMPMHMDTGYRVTAPASPLLSGVLYEADLRPGLSIQCVDIHELTGMQIEAEAGEGVALVILLQGSLDVSFDQCRLQLAATSEGVAQGAFITRMRPAQFTRRSSRGGYARKITMTMSRDWLLDTCARADVEQQVLVRLLDQHLALHYWTPSVRAIAVAEEMLNPPVGSRLLHHLYMESRCLELLAQALPCLSGESAHTALRTLSLRDYERLQALRTLLEGNTADDWSINQIARHVGMSTTRLQRAFRQAFGTTVFEYMRDCRLETARAALAGGRVNVAMAAEMAGYTSAANFSTAFKRRYGISPGQLRRN